MKIVAIIPARFNSQRLPAKILADICGKSMIERVYLQVQKSKLVTEIFVATDDERIAETVKNFGGKFIMTPPELESGSDRIAFASKNIEADIIVNVQGDEPLINPAMIDQTIKILIEDNSAEVSSAVKKILKSEEIFNPNIVKVAIDNFNYGIYFSRSPIPFLRNEPNQNEWLKNAIFYKHFGIYVYRKNALLKFTKFEKSELEKMEMLEQLRFLSNGIKIKIAITEFDSVAVDTIEDLEKVRKIILSQN